MSLLTTIKAKAKAAWQKVRDRPVKLKDRDWEDLGYRQLEEIPGDDEDPAAEGTKPSKGKDGRKGRGGEQSLGK